MRSQIHPNGPRLSTIIAGMWRLNTWNFTTDQLTTWVGQCLDMGVTTFDHADIYGDYSCESIFGDVLSNHPELRSKIQLVTKCGICLLSGKRSSNQVKHYNTSSQHIIRSVEQSLLNLHTDYIDLLLIHRPSPLMNADETAEGMTHLVKEGKVKHIGVSNFTPSQFQLLQSRLEIPLVTNQVECSVLHLDPIYDGTFDQAYRVKSRPMVWSPLGGGELFTGQEGRTEKVRAVLHKLSEKTGLEIDQLALSWLFTLPVNPFVILGTGNIDRVKRAVEATSFDMELQDWFSVLEASNGFAVP